MHIVFLDAASVGPVPNLDLLQELGTLTMYDYTGTDQVVNRARDADILLSNKTQLNKDIIDSLPKLKLICITATGMNNVDLDHAKKKGIPVKNAANYSTDSVAQHTFASILYLLHRPDYYDDFVKSRKYSRSRLFTHYGPEITELSGKNFGIIGLGAIGARVASIATAFGARVSYYSTSGKNNNGTYQRLELDALLTASDIISIHAPLNAATKDLIGYKEIVKMETDGLLLNTGRGGIIVEKDLARALDEGYLRGASLDVFENEPIEADNPLLHLKNSQKLHLTPHIAWTSVEARTKLIAITAENIRQFITKEK